MKLFSSIITLLLTSAAAANKAHDIIAKPHIAKIINKVQSAKKDDDVHCMKEVEALFDCLGDQCINCFMDIIEDLTEDTTCEDLENSSFCSDIDACIFGSCSANDCTKVAEDVESCAAKHYPESSGDDDDEMCPGLCEVEKKERVAVVEETVSKETSVVRVANKANNIIANPHIAKIISNIQSAKKDDDIDDIPCMVEAEAFFECIGDQCIDCIMDIFEDLTEETTCEDLEDGTFCSEIDACLSGHCAANDCDKAADDLESCAATHYPESSGDVDDDEMCPDLCEVENMKENKAFAIA